MIFLIFINKVIFMIILLIILVGFGLLSYFTVFKKSKSVNPTNVSGDDQQNLCKKYKVKIADQSKVENLAWIDCNGKFQGGNINDGDEICVKTIVYHNQTNLELIEIGICN